MNDAHETYRELIALRHYDELDSEESQRLDVHLAECASCREFQTLLASDLTDLPVMERSDEPSDRWLERLRAETRRTTRWYAAPGTWVASVASFAAGILLMIAVNSPEQTEPGKNGKVATVPTDAFARSAPPPPATARAPFAALFSSR